MFVNFSANLYNFMRERRSYKTFVKFIPDFQNFPHTHVRDFYESGIEIPSFKMSEIFVDFSGVLQQICEKKATIWGAQSMGILVIPIAFKKHKHIQIKYDKKTCKDMKQYMPTCTDMHRC